MTSEPEKLLPVAWADRVAAHNLERRKLEQQHGRVDWIDDALAPMLTAEQDDHSTIQAFARHRLSSPVSGTDMVMRERLARVIYGWTPRVRDYDHGLVGDIADADRHAREIIDLLSASPTPPIPVIAEAGEREAQGTFACPICGEEKPHHHTAPVVDAYQTKGSRK